MGKFIKGHIPWNKNVKGIHLSPNTEFKKGHKHSKKHGDRLKILFEENRLNGKIKSFENGHVPWNKGLKGFRKGYIMTEEHKERIRKANSGENHYRWNPDRNVLILNKRNDPEYKQFVSKVKKRDNGICKLKGRDCSGYNIVHHIMQWALYPELRYKISNGITLCQYHHPKKREDEERLKPILQELVVGQMN